MRKGLRNRKARGFTLIELLTVIAIIAVLGAAVSGVVTGGKEAGYEAAAQKTLKEISAALSTYYAEKGEFPPDLAGLRGRYIPDKYYEGNNILDPWRQPIGYVNNFNPALGRGLVAVYCVPPSGAPASSVSGVGNVRNTSKGKPLVEILSQ